MTYAIIQPPFELKFREMSRSDLLAYQNWFHSVMSARTLELTMAVKATPGFESWVPDFLPDSLSLLSKWFHCEVKTRSRTAAETTEIESRLTFPIDVPYDELTNRTFSLAFDIGMYFGQVVVRTLPGTRWDQPMKNRKFADYGQPVIIGLGTTPLNPVRIAVTLAYAFAANEQPEDRLRVLFDIWSKKRI